MLSKKEHEKAQIQAAKMIREAGIIITDREPENIEVVDFGLGNLQMEGVQVLTFFNTKRIAAKILVLFPNQTEPEHRHPQVGDDPVLVQPELDKSLLQLRDKLAFGKRFF